MSIPVERIRLKNVFGVDRLDFDPDGVTVIKGRNGSGKTSVIRAIHRLMQGGQHPDMLKKGEEDGHVILQLADGVEVEASLTTKGTYYHLRGRDDMSARKLINTLTDEVAVNPISILKARAQDRGQILLEALPMRVEEDEIRSALAPLDQKTQDEISRKLPDLDGHALDVLGESSSGVIVVLSDERRSYYGAKRDKQGTVSDLEESVGEDVSNPDEIREKRREVNDQLRETKREESEALQEVDDWKEDQIQQIRYEAEERKSQIRHEHEGDLDKLKEKRAKLQERIEQAERQQQTRETIQQRKAELEELQDLYSSLTDAIENLRALKTDYRDDLPEDVYIEDGEIYDSDDIPFETWNEERKIRFATMIAEMRMGDLQIIPIDGIEKLVGSQRELFMQWAEESPAQFIFTEAVAGQDLTVEHPGQAEANTEEEDDNGEDEEGDEIDEDEIPF